MRALLLLAALLSANPPPPRAGPEARSARSAWEELYLAYSSVDAQGLRGTAQRRTIAASLLKGCEALASSDAVMAYSLGERAVALRGDGPGLRCLARTALASDQRGSAEEALRTRPGALPQGRPLRAGAGPAPARGQGSPGRPRRAGEGASALARGRQGQGAACRRPAAAVQRGDRGTRPGPRHRAALHRRDRGQELEGLRCSPPPPPPASPTSPA